MIHVAYPSNTWYPVTAISARFFIPAIDELSQLGKTVGGKYVSFQLTDTRLEMGRDGAIGSKVSLLVIWINVSVLEETCTRRKEMMRNEKR